MTNPNQQWIDLGIMVVCLAVAVLSWKLYVWVRWGRKAPRG